MDRNVRRDWRAPVPQGRSTFDLLLGGVRVRVRDLPVAWEPFVVEQYSPYATPVGDDAPRADLEIACREGDGLVVPLPPPGEMIVIELARVAPKRYTIRSHWQDGWIDLAQGRGEIVLTNRAWDLFSSSIENFLRVAFQVQLIERDAFLMHTAAILDADRRAFLFFGPSGAGKSTATAFSAPRHALSDDMIMVDVAEDTPRIWSVPFFMVFPPEQRLAGAFPVAAALRLRQSPEDRLDVLSPARAIATVSASVPFVHELGLPHEGLTRLVTRFCARTPVADLHFTKSARFWELLVQRFPA